MPVPFAPPRSRRAAAVLIALGGAFAAGASEPYTVALTEVRDEKAVFATVEALDVTAARARIGGVVTSLLVTEGERVAAGQRLAVIGDEKLGLEASAAGANIRALEAARANARVELERARDLFGRGIVAQARLDAAQSGFDVADAQLAAARAARAVVGEREAEGVVLAPGDGVVLAVPVVEGSVVMAGEAVADIASAGYVLRLSLPERHARHLADGDAVRVEAAALEAGDGRNGRGVITRVYPRIENGRVAADAAVDGLGQYFVGERVRVIVETEPRPAILVPERYLATRYGVDFASLAGPDGATREIVVQRGRPAALAGEDGAGDALIEVLSGLAPGDVLVAP